MDSNGGKWLYNIYASKERPGYETPNDNRNKILLSEKCINKQFFVQFAFFIDLIYLLTPIYFKLII